MLTKKEFSRLREIIRQLCELSRDGWRHAKPCDYRPLEAELKALEAKRKHARTNVRPLRRAL
jgi:hypothetical protein